MTKIKYFRLNKSGLSLVELLMSMAVLTIVVMGVMELRRGEANSQTRDNSHLDYMQVVSEFLFLLDPERERNCISSLANPDDPANPIRFEAADIQGDDYLNDGVEFELYITPTTSATFARGRMRFGQGMSFGNINIENVILHLPDYIGPNFSPADDLTTNDTTIGLQAEIVLLLSRRINTTDRSNLPPIRRSIIINFTTNGAGLSTITNCST